MELRELPSVDELLRNEEVARLPHAAGVAAAREALARAREEVAAGLDPGDLVQRTLAAAAARHSARLRRAINATGVVLHTNLGRAPLGEPARAALADIAAGYCSLEFDLETGRRGERTPGVERWLCRLTGAEAALVVNNGAAAVLLALASLAAGRLVVVSRGELVEIGGSFRIPEVLERSGARLLEIGTTNRTHLRDYERALASHKGSVGAILRVHRSNFRMSGFTASPALEELAKLARRHRVPLIEDLGSGALTDLSELGLEREPTVRESLNAGCDVVTFSGDKLLGATQAGLLLGRRRPIERARKDPLARALRVDKLTLAALEATLPAYGDPVRAAREIPVLAMLGTASDVLEQRARTLAEAIGSRVPKLRVTVERGFGEVGGGALPLQRLPGWVVALEHPERTVDELDRWARSSDPPIIGYVRTGKFRMDVRTLSDREAQEAAETLGRTPL